MEAKVGGKVEAMEGVRHEQGDPLVAELTPTRVPPSASGGGGMLYWSAGLVTLILASVLAADPDRAAQSRREGAVGGRNFEGSGSSHAHRPQAGSHDGGSAGGYSPASGPFSRLYAQAAAQGAEAGLWSDGGDGAIYTPETAAAARRARKGKGKLAEERGKIRARKAARSEMLSEHLNARKGGGKGGSGGARSSTGTGGGAPSQKPAFDALGGGGSAEGGSAAIAGSLLAFVAMLLPGGQERIAPIQLLLALAGWAVAAVGLRRGGWRYPVLCGALVALGTQEVVEKAFLALVESP